MAWIVLIVSGVFEAIWATALGESHGFSETAPTVVFLVALAISMAGLGLAVKHRAIGTAYAVWVGIGAVGTAVVGMLAFGEPATAGRLVSIVLVVAGVVGLQLTSR